jgi:hypothetical protein
MGQDQKRKRNGRENPEVHTNIRKHYRKESKWIQKAYTKNLHKTGKSKSHAKTVWEVKMGLTTDHNDPGLHEYDETGQQKMYLVLSEEERAKGFIRPYRDSYIHLECHTSTTMGRALSETYARDPSFYGATFCYHCGKHFPLKIWNEHLEKFIPAFVWEDNTPVGD